MAKIKTPTHVTFWDFNDTFGNIWFSTFRLINRQTAARYTERTCGGQKPQLIFFSNTELAEETEPLKSGVEWPQLKSLMASVSFVVVVTQTFNAHSYEKKQDLQR